MFTIIAMLSMWIHCPLHAIITCNNCATTVPHHGFIEGNSASHDIWKLKNTSAPEAVVTPPVVRLILPKALKSCLVYFYRNFRGSTRATIPPHICIILHSFNPVGMICPLIWSTKKQFYHEAPFHWLPLSPLSPQCNQCECK